MSNDNYNAPVIPERLQFLKQRTTDLQERFNRFWNHTLDSMELSGLADELEWLAESYRACRDKSVTEHQEGMRLRVVTCRPVSDRIHREDGNVAGRYRYWTMTDEEALDAFHSTEPVKMLEDWDITVEPQVEAPA